MPNNGEMQTFSDTEIIQTLGGITAVARLLGIRPPSVHGWLSAGIPDHRLRELAGELERVTAGKFNRKERWPEKHAFYWPELAQASTNTAQAATETVATQGV